MTLSLVEARINLGGMATNRYANTQGVAPIITNQPISTIATAKTPTTFSVGTSGTKPIYYQWALNGTNLPGATANTLTIPSVTQTNLGSYSVVVSNRFGTVTSSNALLQLYPFLATPISGAIAYWGKDATLSVVAWGTAPLSYQWYDNGMAIANATNHSLSLTNVQFSDAGLYSVSVSNPLGSITNAPQQLVVNPAGVSLATYPGITIEGVVGYKYVIQRSPTLSDTNSWVTLSTLTLTQPTILYVDTNSVASMPGNPPQYYRILPGQ